MIYLPKKRKSKTVTSKKIDKVKESKKSISVKTETKNTTNKIKPQDKKKIESKEKKEKNKRENTSIIREPAEVKYSLELQALKEADKRNKKPINWELSPQKVIEYIHGSDKKYSITDPETGKKVIVPITKKFYGDKHIIELAIVTLASDRGLLLVGEPGTGKSWLSEHLSAAISGKSTYIIQGTSGTTEEQIKYGWNIALMIANGQNMESLIPSPTMTAMNNGKILRFEEITRCISDIQDSLVSIMSEKTIAIPELTSENMVFAKPGFNIIATANLRDKGVNELSAALKRRFNYVHIPIIKNLSTEMKLVKERTTDLLRSSNFDVDIPKDVVSILCQTFSELRDGKSSEGVRITKSKNIMSTAEEIAVLHDAAINAHFFGDKNLKGASKVKLDDIAKTLPSSVVKEDEKDLVAIKEYWDLVLRQRAKNQENWKLLYEAGKKIF